MAAANPQPNMPPPVNATPGMPPANDLPVLKPLPGDSERQRLLKARYNAAVRAEELYNWQYEVGTARASDVLAAEKSSSRLDSPCANPSEKSFEFASSTGAPSNGSRPRRKLSSKAAVSPTSPQSTKPRPAKPASMPNSR